MAHPLRRGSARYAVGFIPIALQFVPVRHALPIVMAISSSPTTLRAATFWIYRKARRRSGCGTRSVAPLAISPWRPSELDILHSSMRQPASLSPQGRTLRRLRARFVVAAIFVAPTWSKLILCSRLLARSCENGTLSSGSILLGKKFGKPSCKSSAPVGCGTAGRRLEIWPDAP